MICTSLHHKNLEELFEALDSPLVEMAEIRLDLCPLNNEEIEELFSSCEKALIACCRVDGNDMQLWEQAYLKMETAVKAGAAYVDLDISAPASISQRVQKLAKNCPVTLIRSYHNFELTPDDDYLRKAVLRCFRYGADIAKLACMPQCPEDVARLQAFYRAGFAENADIVPSRLLMFSMGEMGRESRIECLANGAPFSFAYLDQPCAAGQWQLDDMHKRLYGDWHGVFRNDFQAPCSKSFAQRAIVAAALAGGTSRLEHYSECEDNKAAIGFAKSIGARVRHGKGRLIIEGIGADSSTKLEKPCVNVHESGLMARLALPLLSVLGSDERQIKGEGTLLQRPLSNAEEIMAAFGILLKNEDTQHKKGIYVPLSIKGKFYPGIANIPGQGGSQLISGLLAALPLCDRESKLYVSEPKSIPYMFMTQDVLRHFGAKIDCELEGDAQMLELQDWTYCTGINFRIRPNGGYKAADIVLEGDWSAAANFLVCGALFGAAEVQGLDCRSVQADISILDILSDAGACVAYDENCVSVRRAPLQSLNFDLSHAPDIFPIASIFAAFCPGESRFAGVSRLHNKESNRADAIVQILTQMGVEASIQGNDLVIKGESLSSRMLNGHLLKGGKYSSRHDHRLVMALKVASYAADSEIEIDDCACVGKSFPGFFEQMDN